MFEINKYASLISELAGPSNVKINEPMNLHTSFRVGGPADLMVTPQSTEDIVKIVKVCRENGIPLFIMGNGTNLVVRDKGIRGIVVKILDNISGCTVEDDMIAADAGILLSKVSKTALECGLTGLEFAEGIPGTLGGAVAMNAGAYIGDMSGVVGKTQYIDRNGEIRIIEGMEHQFGYRSSLIQKEGGIAVKSQLLLKKGKKDEIKGLMDEFSKRRRDVQPLDMPSAGSIFKRPEGYYAGKLIQDCGLKGYRIGGAEVSNKHCGFIVNAGGASAGDILRLIEHIQYTVKDRFGVELHTEVRIIGEE